MFGKHLNATRKRVHPAYKTGKKEKEKKRCAKIKPQVCLNLQD